MQGVLLHVILMLALSTCGIGHGSMSSPRPRNNEKNATHVAQKTMDRFVRTDTGIMIESFVHGHGMCSGPVVSATAGEGICMKYAAFAISEKLSTIPPSLPGKMVIDCTAHNDCSLGSLIAGKIDASEGVLWLETWSGAGGANCSGKADVTYKLNLDACTAFEGLQLSSTTPGCEGLSCLWFSQGCGIGCPKCTEDNSNFFHSPCNGTKKPTINTPQLRTFNRFGTDSQGDWTASHPWRAPGSAPVLDPCGMAGGSTKNNDQAAGYAPAPNHRMGDLGSNLMPSADVVWEVDSQVEVSWTIWANHGGGYQYRLCPKTHNLTEECFTRMPLPFAGNTQKLRTGSGKMLDIPASLVSVGTLPEGSTWAMNPVPACSEWTGSNCTSPQFRPPPGCDEDCWGYLGPGAGHSSQHVLPTIIDKLSVPSAITPGEYVLGWRWDCEQTPQIWASCADVKIVAKGELVI